MSTESDALTVLREAVRWLLTVAERCCQCTDGHHDQHYAYGTDSDVRISRDAARALADWFEAAAGDLWAYGPLCGCGSGCAACDDSIWQPHVRSALALAALILPAPSPEGGDR